MTEENSISELMIELHRYHRQLGELRRRFTKGEQIIAFQKEKQIKLQENLDQVHEEQTNLILLAREAEKALQTSENNLKKRHQQLQEAKSNKEYASLKEQIEADEQINNKLAEKALSLIEQVEAFLETVNAAQNALDEVNKKITQAQTEYDEEKPSLLADIEKYSARVVQAESKVPTAFQESYRPLVRKLGGEAAMAPLKKTYCGNCSQNIPIHCITAIISGKPFTCQACGRLLYIPDNFTLE